MEVINNTDQLSKREIFAFQFLRDLISSPNTYTEERLAVLAVYLANGLLESLAQTPEEIKLRYIQLNRSTRDSY